jgi:hypothetical protein
MGVLGDGVVEVIVMLGLRIDQDDGITTVAVVVMMQPPTMTVTANKTIGAVLTHIELEATFVPMDVAVDGMGAVVAATDLKGDQAGGKGLATVVMLAVVIEVTVGDEKNFVVAHTEVAITKVTEAVEVDTAAEGEAVTRAAPVKLT